jgi:hypothetical protein
MHRTEGNKADNRDKDLSDEGLILCYGYSPKHQHEYVWVTVAQEVEGGNVLDVCPFNFLVRKKTDLWVTREMVQFVMADGAELDIREVRMAECSRSPEKECGPAGFGWRKMCVVFSKESKVLMNTLGIMRKLQELEGKCLLRDVLSHARPSEKVVSSCPVCHSPFLSAASLISLPEITILQVKKQGLCKSMARKIVGLRQPVALNGCRYLVVGAIYFDAIKMHYVFAPVRIPEKKESLPGGDLEEIPFDYQALIMLVRMPKAASQGIISRLSRMTLLRGASAC